MPNLLSRTPLSGAEDDDQLYLVRGSLDHRIRLGDLKPYFQLTSLEAYTTAIQSSILAQNTLLISQVINGEETLHQVSLQDLARVLADLIYPDEDLSLVAVFDSELTEEAEQ